MINYLFIIDKCNRRSFYLFDELKDEGYPVIEFIADKIKIPSDKIPVYIFSPSKNITSNDLNNILNNSIVMAGRCSELELLNDNNIKFYSLLDDEEYRLKNCDITAEGALQLAIANTDISVFVMKVLILGYGRLAKATAKMFNALKAEVSIATYDKNEYESAQKLYEKVFFERQFINSLSDYDVIINTIPAIIIKGCDLGKIRKNTLIIDLASSPGGVDTASLCGTGVNYMPALSLPDKVSPHTAAVCLKDSILKVLKAH